VLPVSPPEKNADALFDAGDIVEAERLYRVEAERLYRVLMKCDSCPTPNPNASCFASLTSTVGEKAYCWARLMDRKIAAEIISDCERPNFASPLLGRVLINCDGGYFLERAPRSLGKDRGNAHDHCC